LAGVNSGLLFPIATGLGGTALSISSVTAGS
jgi:hypothetical protein